MRITSFAAAAALAAVFGFSTVPAAGVGRPGITPVACGNQAWKAIDPTFQALPDAKAYFGSYDGGVYHIEIPDKWNGELMLSSHGYVAAAGDRGLELRVA